MSAPTQPGRLVGLIPPGASIVLPLPGPHAAVRAYGEDLYLGWRYLARIDGLHVTFSLNRKNTETKFLSLDRLRIHAEPTFSLPATRDALTPADLAQSHVATLGMIFPQLKVAQPGVEDFDREIRAEKDNVTDVLTEWFLPGEGLDVLVNQVYSIVSQELTMPFKTRYRPSGRDAAGPAP